MIFNLTNPNKPLRIISIDPGSNTCGFSVVEYDYLTKRKTVIFSTTYVGVKLMRKYSVAEMESYSERHCRNLGYGEKLTELLEAFEPAMVVCESPFAGKFVQAYGALMEQVTMFRIACRNYCFALPFYFRTPTQVKKDMGVNGKTSDKSLMTKALVKREDVDLCDNVIIEELDEHSIDSICVGVTFLDYFHS